MVQSFALVLFLTAIAQAPAGPSMELARVELAGAKRLTPADVTKLAGLALGKTVTVTDLNAAAQRLADSGFFENVKYRYVVAARRATVTFEIEESPWTIPVLVDNFVWFTDAEITNALREELPTFDGTLPKSQEMPDRAIRALQKLLGSKQLPGQVQFFPEAEVSGRILRYVFAVKEPAPALCQLRFPGATAATEPALAEAANALIGTDYSRFTTDNIARGTLTDIFRRRGYWRASIGTPAVTLEQGGACNGVAVTLPIVEGESYAWGGAVWTGNTAIPSPQLDAAFGMRTGELADLSKIQDGIRNVRKLYGRQGYLQQQSPFTPKLDDASKRAVFEFRVSEGPQYKMGTFQVVGLPEQDAAALQERWTLKPGDIFNEDYPDEFLKKEVAPLRLRLAKAGIAKRPLLRSQVDPATRIVNLQLVVN